MKIYGNKPPEGKEPVSPVKKIDRSEAYSSGAGVSSAERVSTSDKVNLSQRARDFEEIRGRIDQLPEQRTEKIKILKESIENGTYSIDSNAIAAKMLREMT
ncbi:Anti-sigma-28 factor, FlgM [Candidatus Magnetobacterium bavaricum]|uniref:Negative regulator of flagellin synthesis n=1 Tax=Candidatus Magnetobacterium bavaricum TaxID=29290 RepID=A0A0F3H045_9BACT|nr:Anti-sigma-28 factor, FlgM [Candidatus Magnetobacterium bavaricum]